ncbi:unnamed protein product [Ilex paraguariensis]|uniref:4-hydroxy-3-methylbut-2-enyl diphosphate reductase n=1 Tax=Ilex paraguariensis TaxID=185542 RepID=A0ABC8RCB2_9AQUA
MDHERQWGIKCAEEVQTPQSLSILFVNHSLTCAPISLSLYLPTMAISVQFSRFSTRTDLPLPESKLFRRRMPVSVRCSGGEAASSSSVTVDSDFDPKVFRHNLTRSKNYNRKGFGLKEETLELMNREYTSDIIKKLKENGHEYTWGNVTVKLAEAYGFCWGVERAVQIAYEARKQFPTEKIWLTNEIIHNPTVNKVHKFPSKH